MFTKAELIEKGRHYFEDKNISIMLATTDGNFFYEASKNYADSHAKTNKIEVVTITRAEAFAKKEAPVENEDVKENEVNEDALMAEYKEETGKNAIFRDKVTKGYLNWKNDK